MFDLLPYLQEENKENETTSLVKDEKKDDSKCIFIEMDETLQDEESLDLHEEIYEQLKIVDNDIKSLKQNVNILLVHDKYQCDENYLIYGFTENKAYGLVLPDDLYLLITLYLNYCNDFHTQKIQHLVEKIYTNKLFNMHELDRFERGRDNTDAMNFYMIRCRIIKFREILKDLSTLYRSSKEYNHCDRSLNTKSITEIVFTLKNGDYGDDNSDLDKVNFCTMRTRDYVSHVGYSGIAEPGRKRGNKYLLLCILLWILICGPSVFIVTAVAVCMIIFVYDEIC